MIGDPPISILTSGIGLGVYVPALLIQQQLPGLRAEVEVLEGYYSDNHQERLLAWQRACQNDFALALIGHRMTRSLEHCLEGARVDALLDRWAQNRCTDFMVWSGFWLPVLERYRARVDRPLHIDCCRIDAVVSASFRIQSEPQDATEIWLWNWEQMRTVYEIPVSDCRPLSFAERSHRLVAHGGGAGLGTYRDRLPESWPCDVIVLDDSRVPRPSDSHYGVDPAWRPWHRRGGRHIFPPFGPVGGPYDSGERHALFELIQRSKAIVSKPGGGTLIDSLSSATPVVLLEPYGYAEERNGALWEHLGFGVSYSKWRDSGWDESILHQLHLNILRRQRNGPDYPGAYARRILERCQS